MRLRKVELNLPLGGLAVAIQSALQVPLSVAREGHAQALRRYQYYRELYDSGRWRHYGDEAKIQRELEQAAADVVRWQAMLEAREAVSDASPDAPPA